jgi:hypothetical protein
MACARWETAYITEWLLYHQAIGFDHVYLYCNDDDPTDLYGQVLPFCRGEAPFVTFHHFPFQGQQFYMMMHALRHYKDASQWIAFLDIDEFLVLPGLDDIREFLRRCPPNWDCIHFNWSFFGNSGHLERPPGSVLTTYTSREDRVHQSTKTITRSAKIDLPRITRKYIIWHGWGGLFGPDFRAVNVLGVPMSVVVGGDDGATYVKSGEVQARIRVTGFINHYAFKSARDFDRRIQRGTLGEFNRQLIWKHAADSGDAEATLKALSAVEDTYLADFWRRLTRDSRAGQIVAMPQLPNIAFGKQADQSSISPCSRGATTRDDAAGAINGSITGEAQCHTGLEARPWWMVDLGALHLIYEVRVFNRVDRPELSERLGAFRIDITDAAGLWVPIHEHDASRPIGGADGYPLIVRLASPVMASRLRVMALGHTCLHLDQVQVHGVPVADMDEAAAATHTPTAHWPQTAPRTSQPGWSPPPPPPSPSPPPPPPSPPPPSPPPSPASRLDRGHGGVPATVAREFGRIALSELLTLAQREPAIQDDFLYVALLAAGGRYARRPPLCQDTVDALRLTQILYAEYIERLEQTYRPTFHVALRDATVLGQGSVVSAGGALLLDSCWEFFSQGGLPPGLIELENRHYQLDKPPSRHIEQPALLVKRPFWRNYGHWLVDGAALLAWLPAMALSADCQIIIGPQEAPKMRAVVRETLDILAPGLTVIEQPDNEVWTFAALHYVTPQHIPPLTMQPAAMAELVARIQRGQPPPTARRRLYVTRAASLGRQLVNEAQVIAVCRQLGFEVVSPEQYSLRDQAALFQSAECVIGVKGAALANVVFGSSATRLFVLSPADWPDPFFWDLAGQRGMAYGEMFGRIVDIHEHQSRHGFEINIQRLTQNLVAFCQPLGQPGAAVLPVASG